MMIKTFGHWTGYVMRTLKRPHPGGGGGGGCFDESSIETYSCFVKQV